MTVSQRVTCEPHERIIVALDDMNEEEVRTRVTTLSPYVGGFKVGSEFCAIIGDRWAISLIREGGKKCMLDRKLSDVPRTMARAAEVWAGYMPWLFTVHASAGPSGLAETAKAKQNMLMAGVTVLTSMDESECRHVFNEMPTAKVHAFALDLVKAGADAIVCSPLELIMLGEDERLDGLVRVIPGIRPMGKDVEDQKRVATPGSAIGNGADYLVIGSAITKDRDPVDMAKLIADEIGSTINV
ncbi:orotidine-5'-phosphate decarboxylase [Candidatus Uhrbacteria bacterium]|nr:orotidine-5'-phosphate decarboxylase [Candidatus Uhrbacteria bacterium]